MSKIVIKTANVTITQTDDGLQLEAAGTPDGVVTDLFQAFTSLHVREERRRVVQEAVGESMGLSEKDMESLKEHVERMGAKH